MKYKSVHIEDAENDRYKTMRVAIQGRLDSSQGEYSRDVVLIRSPNTPRGSRQQLSPPGDRPPLYPTGHASINEV